MFHRLTHGTPALVIAYLFVLVPTFIDLYRGKARVSASLKALPLAATMLLIAMLLVGLLGLIPMLGSSVVSTILGVLLSVALGKGLAGSLLKPPHSEPVHRRGAFVLDSSDGPPPTRQGGYPSRA